MSCELCKASKCGMERVWKGRGIQRELILDPLIVEYKDEKKLFRACQYCREVDRDITDVCAVCCQKFLQTIDNHVMNGNFCNKCSAKIGKIVEGQAFADLSTP